jgi:hypothetical protein
MTDFLKKSLTNDEFVSEVPHMLAFLVLALFSLRVGLEIIKIFI